MAKVAGSIWVEGNRFHLIDQFNREWYLNGIFIKNVTARPGSFWMEATTGNMHFVNEAGTAVYRLPSVFRKYLPLTAKTGSIWLGGDTIGLNNVFSWVRPWDGSQNAEFLSYIYVAAVSTHTDTHGDAAHSDVIHSDGAHTDVAAHTDHNDSHNDVPHQDHTDSSHGDHSDSGTSHNDFSDHSDYNHPKLVHNDGHYSLHGDNYSSPEARSHTDYNETAGPNPGYVNSRHTDVNAHVDIPHGDNPHSDSHGDSPHSDVTGSSSHSDHQDSDPHQDIAHIDTPHQDSTHTDSHGDTHGDTPHQDEPVYVGP
jgi:hypothetical protein